MAFHIGDGPIICKATRMTTEAQLDWVILGETGECVINFPISSASLGFQRTMEIGRDKWEMAKNMGSY